MTTDIEIVTPATETATPVAPAALEAPTKKTKTKRRATYGFKLEFPGAFTLQQLRNLTHRKILAITLRKRIDAALKAGTVKEVGKFRYKSTRGRMRKVYCLANVTNVQLEIENAKLNVGDLVLT